MAGDYLKELPSFNKENFSKFKAEEYFKSLPIHKWIGSKQKDHFVTNNTKPVTYIQTRDNEDYEPQVITTDKTNILLRYLRQQLEVKCFHGNTGFKMNKKWYSF